MLPPSRTAQSLHQFEGLHPQTPCKVPIYDHLLPTQGHVLDTS